MKIFVNRKPINAPWGGGNAFVKAFHDHAPKFGITVTSDATDLDQVDAILIIGVDPDNTGVGFEQAQTARRYLHKHPKIISRINENDARKNTRHVDQQMCDLVEFSDGAIYVSNWLKTYYDHYWLAESAFFKKNRHALAPVIINGVDSEIFHVYGGIKIYDKAELTVKAHHWSNNYMKGFDYYKQIDFFCDQHPEYKFKYIGRIGDVPLMGKNTTVVPPIFGNALGYSLGNQTTMHEIYVSASRFDPGPNHIIEAIACGIETYVHVDGGGAVEFAGADHTFSSFEELQQIMERKMCGEHRPNDFVPSTWEECIKKYVEYIQSIVETK